MAALLEAPPATSALPADLFPTAGQIPPTHRLPAAPIDGANYLLDGKVRRWDGPLAEVSSPLCLRADEHAAPQRPTIGQVPRMDSGAALAAFHAASRAWAQGRGAWPTMSLQGRIAAVERFVEHMLGVREVVVNLLMWEIGKSLAASRREFDRTVEYIRRTVDVLKDVKHTRAHFHSEEGILSQGHRAPLGVCLSMGPFNYPLNETFTTLFPALLMGNTVVVKPPRHGGLVHQTLLPAFAECFPPGVVNFVYGRGTSLALPIMETGRLDVLAFIGSSRAADTLQSRHPRRRHLRSILGLDAKNPALILPDADLDLAARECAIGALAFNGQRCTALKMLFVHESVVEDFLGRLCAAVEAMPAGMPWEDGVQITPLAEPGKAGAMRAFVDDARAKGAKVINATGGQTCESLYRPAVVYPVKPAARLYREEHFGPLVPVRAYRDENEFLDYLSASNYGQQASLFGRDPARLGRLIDPLTNLVCRVNLNTQCQRGPDTLPFTGRKDSAEGTLSITEALRGFSMPAVVATRADKETRAIFEEIVNGRHSNFLLNTDAI